MDHHQLVTGPQTTLRETMERLDRTGEGTCFVVDDHGVLLGSVTDGDLRRALLRDASLDDPVSEAMHRTPRSAPATADDRELLRFFSSGVTHLPLLDERGVVVDVARPERLRRIPLLEPSLGAEELANLATCIESSWISSVGPFVAEFEDAIATRVGLGHALATSSGTTALHLALAGLGIGPGDEVVVPSFTFMATVNAVLHAGATPVVVDVEPGTWTIDPEAVLRALTPRTRAIVPVHIYGMGCDMALLRDIADAHGLLIVEDAAEALGGTLDGEPLGSFGDASTFSFFGNKIISTGEGGMVLFRDEEAAGRARVLRDHGMAPGRRYWHDVVGFNHRMTNLQAAIGVAQMGKLDRFLERHSRLFDAYDAQLVDVPFLTPQDHRRRPGGARWLYTVLLDDDLGIDRDELIDALRTVGIETRPAFHAAHEMPLYAPWCGAGGYPVSDDVARRGVSLPTSVNLEADDVAAVVGAVEAIVAAARPPVAAHTAR